MFAGFRQGLKQVAVRIHEKGHPKDFSIIGCPFCVVDFFATKEEILVTFLALLELIRKRSATVSQNEAFGEIYIAAGENLGDDESGDTYEDE